MSKVELTRDAKNLLRDVRIYRASHAAARVRRDGSAMETFKRYELETCRDLADEMLKVYRANG